MKTNKKVELDDSLTMESRWFWYQVDGDGNLTLLKHGQLTDWYGYKTKKEAMNEFHKYLDANHYYEVAKKYVLLETHKVIMKCMNIK